MNYINWKESIMSQLIALTEYRLKRFVEGSRPDLRTLQNLIDTGEIEGKKLGRRYFVEVDENFVEISQLERELFSHG